MHSNKYEVVKRNYRLGLWGIDRVRNAVDKNWITEEEFEEITGESFEE